MVGSERTSAEWYTEAERCYLENHQGCAWCGGSYRVYRKERDGSVEYYCHNCDFRAGRNGETSQFFVVPGARMRNKQPETMFDI